MAKKKSIAPLVALAFLALVALALAVFQPFREPGLPAVPTSKAPVVLPGTNSGPKDTVSPFKGGREPSLEPN